LISAVKKVKGLRVNGVWIDTTTGRVRCRSVAEAIDYAVRARILNPKWIESMLRHGCDGAREIVKRVRNIVELAAITGKVPGCVFDEVARSYILDDEVRQRLIREKQVGLQRDAENPLRSVREGLLETREGGYRGCEEGS